MNTTTTPPTTPMKRGLSATPPRHVRPDSVKRPRYAVPATAIVVVAALPLAPVASNVAGNK